MEDHYDRKIVYSTDREHKNLYEWCLRELDTDGNKLGRDWIPWAWTLYFRAKDVSLRENWGTSDLYSMDEALGTRETQERRVIRASLYPDFADSSPPSYSILGTDRTISSFDLLVEEIPDEQEEHCSTYGIVSYTTDIDFRDVTTDDSLTIRFWVHAEAFRYYAQRVASGEVDSLIVRIGRVAGLYSSWSPGITTDKIKILTDDRKHVVVNEPQDLVLPRLGDVGEAELYFAREISLASPPLAPDEPEEFELEEGPVDRAASVEAVRERRSRDTANAIYSLQIAAWVIAVLLLALLWVNYRAGR